MFFKGTYRSSTRLWSNPFWFILSLGYGDSLVNAGPLQCIHLTVTKPWTDTVDLSVRQNYIYMSPLFGLSHTHNSLYYTGLLCSVDTEYWLWILYIEYSMCKTEYRKRWTVCRRQYNHKIWLSILCKQIVYKKSFINRMYTCFNRKKDCLLKTLPSFAVLEINVNSGHTVRTSLVERKRNPDPNCLMEKNNLFTNMVELNNMYRITPGYIKQKTDSLTIKKFWH